MEAVYGYRKHFLGGGIRSVRLGADEASSVYVGADRVYVGDRVVGHVRIGSRDYPYVRIGDLYWIAENLREDVTGSYWYDYDESYGELGFGKLYKWSSLSSVTSLLPSGWRLPTQGDFVSLTEACPDPRDAAKYGALEVDTYDGSGFGAVPSGSGNLGPSQPAPFKLKGTHGIYWTTTKYSSSRAYNPIICIGEVGTLEYFPNNTADVELDYNLFSVRACRSAV